jgi:hypothetical protein
MMGPGDLEKQIRSYRTLLQQASTTSDYAYELKLREVLHEVVRDLERGVYSEDEAHTVWKGIIPPVIVTKNNVIKNDGIFNISFDSADALVRLIAARRRKNK